MKTKPKKPSAGPAVICLSGHLPAPRALGSTEAGALDPGAELEAELEEMAGEQEDIEADFEAEKAQQEKEEQPEDLDAFLPGWNTWTGPGVNKEKEVRKALFWEIQPRGSYVLPHSHAPLVFFICLFRKRFISLEIPVLQVLVLPSAGEKTQKVPPQSPQGQPSGLGAASRGDLRAADQQGLPQAPAEGSALSLSGRGQLGASHEAAHRPTVGH